MIRWERCEGSRDYDLCTLKLGRPQLPNYTYIVSGQTGDAVLIDPGYAADVILREIVAHRLVLRAILLTHGHSDHIAATPEILAHISVPVYLLEKEQLDHGYELTNVVRCRYDEPIRAGTIEILPLSTPGHSPGSACYLIDDLLFTGDTVFIEACGNCSAPTGCIDAMFDSVAMLKRRIAADVRVFPGHRYRAEPGASFGFVCKTNIYFRLEQRAAFAEFYRRSAPVHPREVAANAVP